NGAHDLKIGGEIVYIMYNYLITTYREGAMVFSALPTDITSRIPYDAPFDTSKWNLSGLEPTIQFFQKYYDPSGFQFDRRHPTWAMWAGDNWRVNNKLTINYGVRWDVVWDVQSVPAVRVNSIPIDNGSTA